MALALEHDPQILPLVFQPARAGNDVEKAFAGGLRRNPARRREFVVHLTDDGDQRGVLSDKATTACGSIARFLMRLTISCST